MAGSNDNWGTMSSGFDDKEYLTDKLDFISLEKIKKPKDFRFAGPIVCYKQVWLPIYKDGKQIINKKNKPLTIPFMLTNYDGKTQKFIEDKECPFQTVSEKMNKYLGDKEQIREQIVFISNVINRDLQEDKPGKIKPPSKDEEKTGFKEKDSKHWNPVECVNMTSTAFGKAKGIMEVNTVKLKDGTKVSKSLADPKYGCDVSFKWDPDNKVPANRFQINKGDRTPLTEEEVEYLLWDIESAVKSIILKPADAKREAERILAEFMKGQKKGKKDEDGDEPEDLENEKPKNKKKKDIDLGEDDEEENPKGKKKKSDSEYDEDDDKPNYVKMSLKKLKAAAEDKELNVKKIIKDCDDEDEEEEALRKALKKYDAENEEDKPKAKNKKSDPEDDEDEEEKPKGKKKVELDEDDDKPNYAKMTLKKLKDAAEDKDLPVKKIIKDCDDEDEEAAALRKVLKKYDAENEEEKSKAKNKKKDKDEDEDEDNENEDDVDLDE